MLHHGESQFTYRGEQLKLASPKLLLVHFIGFPLNEIGSLALNSGSSWLQNKNHRVCNVSLRSHPPLLNFTQSESHLSGYQCM